MLDFSQTLLLVVIFVTNLIYGLVSPFLPTVLEEKYISSVWSGVIFSAYAVAMIPSAFIIGSNLDKIGHKVVITFGIF